MKEDGGGGPDRQIANFVGWLVNIVDSDDKCESILNPRGASAADLEVMRRMNND